MTKAKQIKSDLVTLEHNLDLPWRIIDSLTLASCHKARQGLTMNAQAETIGANFLLTIFLFTD